MLSDTATYVKLEHEPTPAFSYILKDIVERGIPLGIINQKQADFIYVSHPTLAVFHSFPKIHKGGPPPP